MANGDLVFKHQDVVDLDRIIAEIPTKYGIPIVQFIQKVAYTRQEEEKAAAQEVLSKGTETLQAQAPILPEGSEETKKA